MRRRNMDDAETMEAKPGKSGFYLVREEILPEAIKKTIRVKEMLKSGQAKKINTAVKEMNLSRSAYYKYKDFVFPFYEASRNKIITLSATLDNRPGSLSRFLNAISDEEANVLTLNQGMPQQGVASVTLAIETANLKIGLEGLIAKLRKIDGVKRLEVLGHGA